MGYQHNCSPTWLDYLALNDQYKIQHPFPWVCTSWGKVGSPVIDTDGIPTEHWGLSLQT